MPSSSGRALCAALAGVAALAATPAGAQERICVEEAAGVCLKFAVVRKVSPAEAAERGLRLDRDARRAVQASLAAAGFYDGAVDGALGPRTRGALRAWQKARGDLANGYMSAAQAKALTAAPAPAEAPEPETAEAAAPEPAAEPVAEPATEPVAAPQHPEPGRTYRSAHVNSFGAKVMLEAERLSGDRMRLTVLIEADRRFRQSCEVPVSGDFDCYLRQQGWNMRILSGAMPAASLNVAEALPNLPSRSESESFNLW